MNNNIKNILKEIFKGVLVGISLLAVGIIGSAYVVKRALVSEEYIRYVITGVLVLSNIIGCLTAMKGTETGKLMKAVGYSAGIMLLLASVNILLFATGFSGVLFMAMAILGTSLAVLLVSIAPKKTKKMKHYKFRIW